MQKIQKKIMALEKNLEKFSCRSLSSGPEANDNEDRQYSIEPETFHSTEEEEEEPAQVINVRIYSDLVTFVSIIRIGISSSGIQGNFLPSIHIRKQEHSKT